MCRPHIRSVRGSMPCTATIDFPYLSHLLHPGYPLHINLRSNPLDLVTDRGRAILLLQQINKDKKYNAKA
jgi:hypothetical protein